MGMFGSVILLLLGALAADEMLTRRRANLRFWLQAIAPLSGLLGVGAALNGLVCVIKMVAYLGFIRHAPFIYLANLAAGAISMTLGLRFGYATVLIWLGKRLSPAQRALGDRLHERLCAQDALLGYAGLALGTFCILINLIK